MSEVVKKEDKSGAVSVRVKFPWLILPFAKSSNSCMLFLGQFLEYLHFMTVLQVEDDLRQLKPSLEKVTVSEGRTTLNTQALNIRVRNLHAQ